MTVNGTRWSSRADAAIALRNALAAVQPVGEHGYDKPVHVATVAGFDVITTPRRYLEPHLNLELGGVPRSSFSVDYDELRSDRPLGIVVKLENRAADLERTRDRIQASEHDLAAEADRARSDYGQPFAHTQALADARARSAELATELAEKDQHHSPAGGPDPSPVPSTSRWWAAVCDALDARITSDPHWPALAAQLERAAKTGTDVAAVLAQVTADKALPDEHPARSLAYLVADVVPDLRSPRPHPALGTGPDAPNGAAAIRAKRRPGHLPPRPAALNPRISSTQPPSNPRRGNFSAQSGTNGCRNSPMRWSRSRVRTCAG